VTNVTSSMGEGRPEPICLQAQHAMRVQMHQPTGLVKVGGFDVTPEVAATLTQAAPEAFQEPAA
jgi:hypothetical protein